MRLFPILFLSVLSGLFLTACTPVDQIKTDIPLNSIEVKDKINPEPSEDSSAATDDASLLQELESDDINIDAEFASFESELSQ